MMANRQAGNGGMGRQRRVLEIAGLIAGSPLTRASADRLGKLLDAASENAADELPTASRLELERNSRDASMALSTLRSNNRIDRSSPEFLAGRLSALADIHGYAASATADSDCLGELDHPAKRAVFEAIARGFTTSAEIAVECGLSADEARPILAEMCCAALIVKFR